MNKNLIPFKKGHKPWNYGLTKETDERVRKSAFSKTIKREMRCCLCGCGFFFKCKINSKQKFINGHYCKLNPPLKNLKKGWDLKKEQRIPNEKRKCVCGCNKKFECKINSKQKFINGHNSKIHPNIPRTIPIETRFCRCGCGFSKGVKINSKWKYKMGHNRRGKKASSETIAKLKKSHIGHTLERFHKKNCICSFCRAKRGEYKGKNHPMYGKIGATFGRTGNLAPNYIDGRSFEPYTTEFNRELKKRIKQRDEYICYLCNVEGKLNKSKTLSIHHIDYNKINCKEDNLITLCKSHNGKVNKNRGYWQKYFDIIIKEYLYGFKHMESF